MTASTRLPADTYQNILLQTLGAVTKDVKLKYVKFHELTHNHVVVISRTDGK
jgi:hypothetical protein